MLTKTSKLLSVITAVVIVMSSALTAFAAPQLMAGNGEGSLLIQLGLSKAEGDKSTAIGGNIDALSDYSIAMGNDIRIPEEAEYAIAIGNWINENNPQTIIGKFCVMLGTQVEANDYGVALGYKAYARGYNSIALGQNAVVTEESAVAVGNGAGAYSTYGISIGTGSRVGWESHNAVAIGTSASVGNNAQNAIALGAGSYTDESNTLSLGMIADMGDGNFYHLTRRITNMSAGINDTDAVNVSQLKTLGSSTASALGGDSKYSFESGTGTLTTSFNVRDNTYSSVQSALDALADSSVAYDGDDKSIVKLGGANGTTITNLAAGVNATDAVNFGQLSSLGDKIASTFGGDFKFESGTLTGGFTYGNETTIQGAFDSIRDELDKLSEGWTFNPVDDAQQSGGDGGAGTGDGVTPPSSSTIKPGDSLTVNAGDDINITQNGDKDYTISVDPSLREEIEEGYTAADSALKTEITEAYQQADSELKTEITEAYQQADSKLKTEITEAYQQADSALKADIDKNSETIGEIGSVLGGAENGYKKPTFDTVTANDINVGKVNISSSGINMGGADIATGGGNIDMGGGRITNVAGGAIAQGSTDAVNGGQLWDAYQRMDAMGGDIYRRMDDLREDVNIVGAHAAALSGLHPIDYNPYEPTTLSAAIGTYRDEYAVAVGVFHYAKENVMFNLGASLCSDGDVMGRAGVSFTVGKSSDKPKVAGTMNGLRNQVIAMQVKLDELEAEKKKDKELLRRNEEIMKQNAELIRELTKKLEAKR